MGKVEDAPNLMKCTLAWPCTFSIEKKKKGHTLMTGTYAERERERSTQETQLIKRERRKGGK